MLFVCNSSFAVSRMIFKAKSRISSNTLVSLSQALGLLCNPVSTQKQRQPPLFPINLLAPLNSNFKELFAILSPGNFNPSIFICMPFLGSRDFHFKFEIISSLLSFATSI
jgi:hypothetical protein